jgi:hypothetical protein
MDKVDSEGKNNKKFNIFSISKGKNEFLWAKQTQETVPKLNNFPLISNRFFFPFQAGEVTVD